MTPGYGRGARGRRTTQLSRPGATRRVHLSLPDSGAKGGALALLVVSLGVLAALLLASTPALPAPVEEAGSKLAPELASALERAEAAGGASRIRAIVVPHAPAPAPAPANRAGVPPAPGGARAVAAEMSTAAQTARRDVEPLLERLAERGEVRVLRRHWLLPAFAVEATPEALRALARDPAVETLLLDRREFVLTSSALPAPAGGPPPPAVPLASEIAWGVTAVRAPEVWDDLGYRGHGVLVALLDTGVDYTHPDLAARIWRNTGEIAGNGRDDDGNGYVDDVRGYDFALDVADPMDDNGHGTHTAGTVVGDGTRGIATGVAPGASLMPLKVLTYGYGYESDSWGALEYAVANGARIVNMSIGWIPCYHGPARAAWRQVIESATAAGVLVVVAAGNEGNDLGMPWYCPPPANIRTPADVPAALAVAASTPESFIAPFSGVGPVTWAGVAGYDDYYFPPGLAKPDLAAPGVDIVSTLPGARYSAPTWDGTSMACPHVSGVAALMLSANPWLAPGEVRAALTGSARDVGDPGPDAHAGAGIVDAYQAVLLVAGSGTADVRTPRAYPGASPDGLRLFPPAPNPAHPEARIAFRLPAPAFVSLAVYDARGRAVSRLAEGTLAAGEHAWAWDGRSPEGQLLASGLYWVRLVAGGEIRVEKLLLAR